MNLRFVRLLLVRQLPSRLKIPVPRGSQTSTGTAPINDGYRRRMSNNRNLKFVLPSVETIYHRFQNQGYCSFVHLNTD